MKITRYLSALFVLAWAMSTIHMSSAEETTPREDSLMERIAPEKRLIFDLAFSPLDSTIATGGAGIKLWDAKTGAPIQRTSFLNANQKEIYHLAFSPDGGTLATSDNFGTINIRNARTGQPIGEPLNPKAGHIRGLAFSPDCERILFSGQNSMGLIHINSRKILWQINLSHSLPLTLEFDPSGKFVLFTFTYNEAAHIYDAETGKHLTQLAHDSSHPVRAATYDPEGSFIATAGIQKIVIWSAETHKALFTLSYPEPHQVAIAFSPDGSVLAAHTGRRVQFISTSTGESIGEIKLAMPATRIKFSPSGDAIGMILNYNEGILLNLAELEMPVASTVWPRLETSLENWAKLSYPYRARFFRSLAVAASDVPTPVAQNWMSHENHDALMARLLLLNALEPIIQDVHSDYFKDQILPRYLKQKQSRNQQVEIKELNDIRLSPLVLKMSLQLLRAGTDALVEFTGSKPDRKKLGDLKVEIGRVLAARPGKHDLRNLLAVLGRCKPLIERHAAHPRTQGIALMMLTLEQYLEKAQ